MICSKPFIAWVEVEVINQKPVQGQEHESEVKAIRGVRSHHPEGAYTAIER